MTMRKINIFAALVVAMSALSCVEEPTGPSGVAGAAVFEASFGAVGKAVLEPGKDESKVAWEAGDQVSVLAGNQNYLYLAASAGYSTILETEASDVPSEGTYYAVYPYDEDAAIIEEKLSTTLPEVQTAVLGSFSTHLAVARTTGTKLAFKNVCGLVKIIVDAENVTKVVFEGNNGEVVAGGIDVTVSDAPTWNQASDKGATSVTLLPAQGQTTLAKGSYYFAALPQTFERGFKVTAYKGDEASVIRNVSDRFTLERADIVGGRAFGIDGSGTEADPYILKTPQDMVDMHSLAQPDATTWFRLGNNIDMAKVKSWCPVNNEGSDGCRIHFDGNGKTITNFSPETFADAQNPSADVAYPSLFGVLCGSCRNLTIKDSKLCPGAKTVAGFIGGFIGDQSVSATVENVHLVNCHISGTGNTYGGLGGHARNATISDCSVQVVIRAGGPDVGGLVGKGTYNVEIKNCTAEVDLAPQSNPGKNLRYGGIFGYHAGTTLAITNCSANGKIACAYSCNTAGGILAYSGSTSSTTISLCTSSVDIRKESGGSLSSAGGMVGIHGTTGTCTIRNCYSTGDMYIHQTCGGIVGRQENGTITITNCYSTSSLEGYSGLGSIVGAATKTSCILNMFGCLGWASSIKGTREDTSKYGSGAIVGSSSGYNTIIGCLRRSDMIFSDPNARPDGLITQDDVNNAELAGTPNTNRPYDGRPASQTTASAAAVAAGWSEKVWDFSAALPAIRDDASDEENGGGDDSGNVENVGVVGYPAAIVTKTKTLLTNYYFTQRTVSEGITYYNAEEMYDAVSGAVQTVNVLEVDLNNPANKVRFYMTGRSTTSSVGKSTNSIACINAAYEQDAIYNRTDCVNHSEVTIRPTDTDEAKARRFWKHEGAIVGDGARRIGMIYGAKGHSTATWDGVTAGGYQAIDIYKKLQEPNVFASAPMLIDDYTLVGTWFVPEPYRSDSSAQSSLNSEDYRRHQGTRHPRTAVALTADNDLLIITVDGRYSGRASGMSAMELTYFINTHFQPRWALNMDGGGSTTMYIKGSQAAGYGRANDLVNHPCQSGSTWTTTTERELNTFFLIQKN